MATDIPVFLIDGQGNDDATNPNCSPCIKVALSSGEKCIDLLGGLSALLDSGAYPSAIDRSVLSFINLPISGNETVHTVAGIKSAGKVAAFLWLHGLSRPFSMELVISDHRKYGHPYDLILGRGFLTMFDFGFDHRFRRWRLSLQTI